jgi:hypothetical protein
MERQIIPPPRLRRGLGVVANNLGKSRFLQVARKNLFLYINFNAVPNSLFYFNSTRCRTRIEHSRRCIGDSMPSLQ